MKRTHKFYFFLSAATLALFVIYTAAVSTVDVGAVGPQNSSVGFSVINKAVHDFFGVHWLLYTITDWAGLVTILVTLGFAMLGLVQLIRRKSLLRIDSSILILGGFYLLVFGAYLLFETMVINYRPVLINGILEASYPSSTTILALCVMPSAMMQFSQRIKHRWLLLFVNSLCAAFAAFMVVGRLISGVHWLTDIIGGCILSTGLVLLYAAVVQLSKTTREGHA